jgi:hypothetical protein
MGFYKAAYFNSNNYIQLPVNALFDRGTGDFTISLWLNCLGCLSTSAHLFGCINNNLANAGFFLNNTSGGANMFLPGYLNNNNNLVCAAGASYLTTPTIWSHWAVIKSGTSIKIYKNTVQAATATNSNNNNFSASYFPSLGLSKNAGTVNSLLGLLEEVSLFNRAITTAELAYIYNSGNGRYADPTDAAANNPFHNGGLIAGYHLNGDCLDFSANALHGTFINGTLFSDGKIVNPNAITPVAGKWYKIDYLIPNDLVSCYIRLANNNYPPILCIYYSTTQSFVSTLTGATYSIDKVFQWCTA